MRVHDVTKFRAVGVRLDWLDLAHPMLEREGAREGLTEQLLDGLKERGSDVRLAWGCSVDLGVPFEPFLVWMRRFRDPELQEVPELDTMPLADGELVWWGGEEAAHVRVHCDVMDSGRPVALFLLRTGLDPQGAVGAAAMDPGGRQTVSLLASAGATTHAVLVNARATAVEYTPLRDVVGADDWKLLELVGLPVIGAELGEYPPDDQGMVDALTSPHEAALQRLDRVGSPLGWYPVTESGRIAPPWVPTDPFGLVEETRKFLLPELPRLYEPGTSERDQQTVEEVRAVDPPSRPEDGVAVAQPAEAKIKPLALLMMPAFSDPSTNVATGFGTGYRTGDLPEDQKEVEFLVTAHYRHSVLGDDVEVAAYVPPVQRHAAVPPVVDLRAIRATLLPPNAADGAFRESIEVSWRPGPTTAMLTGPVAHAFAGWPGAATTADDLLPQRLGGGSQPRTIPTPEGTTLAGADRPKVVHADQELPVDGSVQRGYAVAQADIFGVWSPWEDVELTTASPSVAPPRITRLDLAATYAGSPACPSVLTVDFAVDRTQRTADTVEVRAVLYPMATGKQPPPAGLMPEGGVPIDCHALARTVTFSGDIGNAFPDEVQPLREDGSVSPIWGTPDQGTQSRSYRLTLAGPALDFGVVSRWGAQLWVRQTAPGIATPSTWTPVPDHPATTMVASPVPVVPLPPPQPPDVPLASTPDAQGLCHVRVSWSGLASPNVDRVVVWEASETTLRHRLAPGSRPDPAALPGVRLAQLWAIYDAAPASKRPLGFRRAAEVPAGPGAADLTLPRGSQDVHFFLVTSVTTTGLESPWPDGTVTVPAHAHLQAATSPRLRRPAMPLVRPVVATDGSVGISLAAASPIPVTSFEVFATRSETAARDHLTMGPRHATIAATAAFRPGTAEPLLDTITQQRVWTAEWSGSLQPSWELWHLRAVAVPESTVGPRAERGVTSQASDVVTVSVLPSASPEVDPLVAEVRGSDHKGLLIRTATTAADRVVPAGSHTVQVALDGVDAVRRPLESTDRVADDSTVPDTSAGPVVQRLARAAGRTPLLIWAHRDDPSAPIEVAVRVADPLGRETERTMVVPGWVEPPVGLTLQIIDVFRIVGRGYVASLVTNADPGAVPPYVVTAVATLPGPVFPRPPLAGGRSLRSRWDLPDVPTRRSPVPPRGVAITAVRSSGAAGTEIGLWVPARDLTGLVVTLSHPIQGELRQTWAPH